MSQTATINTRIDPELKRQAEDILKGLGLSNSNAIRIFYTHVCLSKGLPFEVKLPNAKTLDSINELESGKGIKHDSMDDVWNDVIDA